MEFFTVGYLFTLPGAALGVVLAVSALRVLIGEPFEKYSLWTAAVLSVLLSAAIALAAPTVEWTGWLTAFFNMFVIFTSATGTNELWSATSKRDSGWAAPAADPAQGEKWRKSWLS